VVIHLESGTSIPAGRSLSSSALPTANRLLLPRRGDRHALQFASFRIPGLLWQSPRTGR
jgi:hypothetical protein